MKTVVREMDAVWDGNLNDGNGGIDIKQGGDVTFDRTTRFDEDSAGSNPETMAASALAGCYAMSLAGHLSDEGFTPSEVAVSARVMLEKSEGDLPFIPTVNLSARAQVNNIKRGQFMRLADSAREHSPMANLFAGAEITLEAELIGG